MASAGLATVYQMTAERIKENEKLKLQENLKKVIPTADRFEKKGNIFVGYKDNKETGVAIELTSNGYGGPIRMLLGVTFDYKISGIAILSHKETPGLGKKIELPGFQSQFTGKSAGALLLKKDSPEGTIDAITAATISSRAVTTTINNAISQWRDAGVSAKTSATRKSSQQKAVEGKQ